MSKEAFQTKKGSIFWFNPEDLVLITDPSHHLYDSRVEDPADQSLVTNMLHEGQGVLQPIVITKEDDKPVVVAGRQRTKAALEVNKQLRSQGVTKLIQVPCVYRRGTEKNLYSMMVSENEQRRNDDPIEKAKKINQLVNFGNSEKEISEIYGVSIGTIRNWLALLDLDPEVQEQVSKKEIKPSVARKVRKLPKKEQNKAVKELAKKPRKVRNSSVVVSKEMRSRKEIEKILSEYKEILDAYKPTSTNHLSAKECVKVLEWILAPEKDDK